MPSVTDAEIARMRDRDGVDDWAEAAGSSVVSVATRPGGIPVPVAGCSN